MSKTNDGGPAFPGEQGYTPEKGWNQSFEPGMTLRTYIATAAMQGMYASGAAWLDEAQKARAATEQAYAHWAVEAADALIAELNREADIDAAVTYAEHRMERGPNE